MERNLTNEQNMLILLSRYTMDERAKKEISNIINEDLEWLKILNYSIMNKVTGLVFYNVVRLGYEDKIPLYIYNQFRYFYYGTIRKNEIFIKEAEKIYKKFSEKNIYCTPLKGAYLLNKLYKDKGSRTVNDLDFLVNIDQINSIYEIMDELGFKQGDYNKKKNTIENFSREKSITWQLKLNTIPMFVKLCDSDFVDCVQIDLSYSLDLKRNADIVKKMLKESKDNYLKKEHFFTHLCAHLYKEATGAIWIYSSADLSMIKFCDVREFILNFMSKEDIENAIKFANENNLQKAIYFTIYYLKLLYNDGYESEYLKLIDIDELSFINKFGEDDFDNAFEWKKSFYDRLFTLNNKDELKDKEKFIERYEEFLKF